MKINMARRTNWNKTGWIVFVAGCMAVSAGWASVFSGTGGDKLFSNTNNWDVFPTAGANISFAASSTTIGTPAQVDSAFPVFTSSNRLAAVTIAAPAPQTTYLEILDGAHFEGLTVLIGWQTTQATRHGDVTLRTGGTLWAGNGGAGGYLYVGGSSTGKLTVAEGANLRATRIQVNSKATLTFQFGTNSVTTMVGTSTTTGSVNQIDGLLRLDLGALNTGGTYTLIDSKGSQLSGALRTWLDAGGGSRSGTGDVSTANFEIVNSAVDLKWTLTTADVDNRDLVLTVSKGPADDYAAWAAGYGLVDPNGTGAMTADPDEDWVDNLAEYGLGGDPTNSVDQGHVPTSRLLADGGTNWLEYVYYERSDKVALGLDYYPERGLDLVSPGWTNSGIVVAG
ncbi:MAG: hypothetical protein K9M54_09165, partial [Kiritimatiellales bacterium]|nr:hypothetical protein [Kiritimatiellales bacterium]